MSMQQNQHANIIRTMTAESHTSFEAFWRSQADAQNTWASIAIEARPHPVRVQDDAPFPLRKTPT